MESRKPMSKLRLGQIVAGTLAAALLGSAARPARALWVEQEVSAKEPVTNHLKFAVQAKDAEGGLKSIEVTVTAKPGYTISPVALARLTLKMGDNQLALVPLEVQQEGNQAKCWFRLAPQTIAGAQFEFDDLGYGQIKDAAGKTRYIAEPGGIGYKLKVSEFVAP